MLSVMVVWAEQDTFAEENKTEIPLTIRGFCFNWLNRNFQP